MSSNNITYLKSLLVRVAFPLLFAGVIIAALLNGYLTEKTHVPTPFVAAIKFLVSGGALIPAFCALVVVGFAHRCIPGGSAWRKRIRQVFFMLISLITGKMYVCAGIMFGVWALAAMTSMVPVDNSQLVTGIGCILAGLTARVAARYVLLT